EIAQPRLAERGLVLLQFGIELGVLAPHLFEEDVVNDAGGLDQLDQGLAVRRRKVTSLYAQGRGSKAGRHFVELGDIRGSISCSLSVHHGCHQENKKKKSGR